MEPVAIVGVGMTGFGKHPQRSLVDLAAEAARDAIKDAGIRPAQIGAGFFANGLAGRLFGDFTIGQNVLWQVGINRVPVINVENACTSGSTALYLAANAVAAGQAEAAIAVAEGGVGPGGLAVDGGDHRVAVADDLVGVPLAATLAAVLDRHAAIAPRVVRRGLQVADTPHLAVDVGHWRSLAV